MKVLALQPYHGGSHKAFLDGWCQHSAHEWTTLTLPPHKWKWRMRHAAISFAEQLHTEPQSDWDIIWCTDMLNLAEFRGLAPAAIANLPAVIYFHENQLTYPVRRQQERDLHFALTNLVSALAAEAVWFNSAYHRDAFLDALAGLLSRMPDHKMPTAAEQIRAKSAVFPPGISPPQPRRPRGDGPLHILWAARWEHDKDPESFFAAIAELSAMDLPFQLSVVGESFRDVPEVFATVREEFSPHIKNWGYLENREAYNTLLAEADVIVSTAKHEFFGISVVEAVSAGCLPLLPKRLAYPETMAGIDPELAKLVFYDGSVEALSEALTNAITRVEDGKLWPDAPNRLSKHAERYHWSTAAVAMDSALTQLSPHRQRND